MLLYIATAFAGTRQITGGTTTQQNALESCYEQWEGHPFAEPSKQEFTYIEPIIRVLGFGSAEYSDEPTNADTLYLVGMNVNDLTRTTYTLNNPNGWYCFYNNVTVLAKQEVHVVRGAHIADANDPVHVLGRGDPDHSGIIVLGGVGLYWKD